MSPASPDTASNPHTPCSRDSHRLLSSEDTRCSTPDFSFEERVRCRFLWRRRQRRRLRVDTTLPCLQTVAPWERRAFPLPEDPAPEPEADGEQHARPRMRSISGCRAAYGRLDSDDAAAADLPCDDDKVKASTQR